MSPVTLHTKQSSSAKVMVAYGNFFRSSLGNGADTFLDHVLDEVIAGRHNALAAACARGGRVPKPVEIAAAAADLELIQRLCVSETTVLNWCRLAAKNASPGRVQPDSWLAAAGKLGAGGGVSFVVEKVEPPEDGGMGIGMGMGADVGKGTDAEAAAAAVAAGGGEGTAAAVLAPASAAARRALRQSIAQSWSWGQALPSLMKHWHDHGTGIP